MKRCEEVVPLLGPLLDGALPEDDGAWVLDHLAGCASCQDRKALFTAQGDALRESLARQVAGADFSKLADRVMSRIVAEKRLSLSRRIPLWGGEMWGAHRGAFAAVSGLAAAAGLALAVFLVGPLQPQPGFEQTLLVDAAQPQVEEVDFGSHDGAVLQLANETTVIWMSEDRPGMAQ